MPAAFADPAELLDAVIAEVWAPRNDLPLDIWCDTHRVLASEGTAAARSGPWDTENTPYLREPMRRLQDPEVRELAYWKSAQIGYTDGILVNWLLYLIAEKRQAAMVVYPTADKGVAVNRRRILPTVRACPLTAGMLRAAKDLTDKELRIGNIPVWFGYSKSADSLRGDPVGPIAADEIDAFDNSENDTLAQCRSRQTTFAERMLVKGSTPETDAGIIREYKKAAVRWAFMVPCPFTGRFFELWEFSQLGWFGGLSATPASAAASVYVASPFAEPGETLRIREHLKPWMVRNGLWVTQDESVESDGSILAGLDRETGQTTLPTLGRLTSDFFRAADQEPDRRLRDQGKTADDADALRDRLGVRIAGTRNRGPSHAYRSNSLTSLIDGDGWGGTVAHFVREKGRPEPTWYKERLGQPPAARAERLEVTALRALCLPSPPGHKHGEVPAWAVAAATLVDVQKDCVKLGVWAYGPEARRRALCYTAVVERDPARMLEEPHLREALASVELRRCHSAERVRPLGVFIDSGHWTEDVYMLCRWLRHRGAPAFPVKGTDRDGNGRRVWDSVVTDRNLPDGRREKRPDPIRLWHYSDQYLSAAFVASALAAPDMDTGELDGLAGLDTGDLGGVRVQLPDPEGWAMRERVLAEMANVHRVTLGAGSGRSGKDGRGTPREEWRKHHAHLDNDFFDIAKMNLIPVHVLQLDRWTAEKLRERPAAQRRVRGRMEV